MKKRRSRSTRSGVGWMRMLGGTHSTRAQAEQEGGGLAARGGSRRARRGGGGVGGLWGSAARGERGQE